MVGDSEYTKYFSTHCLLINLVEMEKKNTRRGFNIGDAKAP